MNTLLTPSDGTAAQRQWSLVLDDLPVVSIALVPASVLALFFTDARLFPGRTGISMFLPITGLQILHPPIGVYNGTVTILPTAAPTALAAVTACLALQMLWFRESVAATLPACTTGITLMAALFGARSYRGRRLLNAPVPVRSGCALQPTRSHLPIASGT
jgi:hypothetical protein